MPPAAVFSQASGGVLIASPSTFLREQVVHSLNDARPVQQALGGAEALVKLETGNWQVLFLDRRLPDLDAEELIETIHRRFPDIEVVVLDSNSRHPLPLATASADCTAQLDRAHLDRIPKAFAHGRVGRSSENKTWRYSPGQSEIDPLPGMIGQSEAMQRLYRITRLVAPRATTVLIAGPTGTGKELVARAIHQLSTRAARPFLVVNCAAIPESLLESELFGHARGAFTGAVQSHLGRIQAAQGGTLFLDEIGELPMSLQAKLLRFLEHKEVQRLGSTDTVRVDVRVVAATNAELLQVVDAGKFREDLYYRLAAFPLELPSLAERVEDIVPLAEHFLALLAAVNLPCPSLSTETIRILEAHSWPGNVRELQHVIECASILAEDSDSIRPEHLYFPSARRSWQAKKDGIGRSEV